MLSEEAFSGMIFEPFLVPYIVLEHVQGLVARLVRHLEDACPVTQQLRAALVKKPLRKEWPA